MGTTFALCYAIWDHAGDDQPNVAWHRRLVQSIAPTTIGRYIAEANLDANTAARDSFTPPVWARLQSLKQRWDPDNLFHGFLEANNHREESR
jgi:FAD/FMN-containing dehydrogenase